MDQVEQVRKIKYVVLAVIWIVAGMVLLHGESSSYIALWVGMGNVIIYAMVEILFQVWSRQKSSSI